MIIYRETMSTIFINPVLSTDQPSIALQFNGNLEMSEDEFFDFCQLNKELRIERNALGEISILSPCRRNTGIVFFTDEMSFLKKDMIDDEANPLQMVYFVDVSISRVMAKITAYRIVGFHGKEPLD